MITRDTNLLNRSEKWAACLFIAAGVWTLMAFAFPPLVGMMVFFGAVTLIGYPFVWLAMQLPALFVYLALAAPVYLGLRRWSRPVAAAVSLAISAAVGVLVPLQANQHIERMVEDATARDHGAPVELPEGGRVAHLFSYTWDWGSTGCAEDCQRLLFSGMAREVLIGDDDALDGKARLSRYWIGPARGRCPAPRLSGGYASDEDVGRNAPPPRPPLSSVLAQAYGDGKCFYEGRATIDDADVVLVQQTSFGEKTLIAGVFDPGLATLSGFNRKTVYVREGGKLRELMRRTEATASRLRVPLWLEGPFAFDTFSPGRWSRAKAISSGPPIDARLSGMMTNDLRVSGLVDANGYSYPPV